MNLKVMAIFIILQVNFTGYSY